jgi:hypothetical protein
MADELRALLAGQTGISKSTALARLIEAATRAERLKLRAEDFGVAEVEKYIPAFHEYLVVKASRYQRRRWHEGWMAAREAIKRSRFQILGAHLMCCFEGRFFSPVRPADLLGFDPDVIVTLIDDCYDVSARIDAAAQAMGIAYHFRLREILSWRHVETAMATQLQSIVNQSRHSKAVERGQDRWRPCRHFILPVKHDPYVLLNLLLQFDELARTYMSFPISSVRGSREAVREINAYRTAVSDVAIAFDPLCMDERVLLQDLPREGDRVVLDPSSRWQVRPGLGPPASGKPMLLDASEVLEVHAIIDDMIEERDFRLIDQASSIFAYRPWWGRRSSVSSGMQAELYYARDNAGVRIFMFDPERDHGDERAAFAVRPPQGHVETRDEGLAHLVDRLAEYDEGKGPSEVPISTTEGLL